MEKSLQQRIQDYLQAQPGIWVSGDMIEHKSQEAGYKASTGSRRARELAEDGVIQRREDKGYVEYMMGEYVPKKFEYRFDPERKCMVEYEV